jgi:choline dehydrogenase
LGFDDVLPYFARPGVTWFRPPAIRRADRPPAIDFRCYEHRADLDTLITGLEMMRDIADRKPLAPYLAEPLLLGTSTPDRARLAEHVRRYTQTLYHPIGTCAMGAVLDPRLRGVDASVMPAVVRGNTNAPVVMIAETAADLLR